MCTQIPLNFLKGLTGLVVLSLAGDSEGVDVETEVPRHRVQQQHRERPVGVVVVHQRVNLSRLQPVTSHIALSVEQRTQHVSCRQELREKEIKWATMRETLHEKYCNKNIDLRLNFI